MDGDTITTLVTVVVSLVSLIGFIVKTLLNEMREWRKTMENGLSKYAEALKENTEQLAKIAEKLDYIINRLEDGRRGS